MRIVVAGARSSPRVLLVADSLELPSAERVTLEELAQEALASVDVIVTDERAASAVEERWLATVPLLVVGEGAHPRATAVARPSARAEEIEKLIALLAELRALRAAADITDAALASSVTGLAIADARAPGTPLLYVSPVFESLTGYGSAEVLGKNCAFLQGPETDPSAARALGDAIRERRFGRTLIRNYRRDGSAFWNEVTVFPIRDERGELVFYGGVQHDVTQLVETKSALASAQRELADRHAFTLAILEGLQVAIVTTDPAGVLTFANRAACGLLGLDHDYAGKDVARALQLPEEAHRWLVSGGGEVQSFEFLLELPSARVRELSVSIRRAEHPSPGLGHLLVFRDLGENRVHERVERLAAVSTMAAGFAHEVRNPLASVRMFGEVLLGELDPASEHHDIVARMLQQVNRIERLVRTSLQVARPAKANKGTHWPSVIVNGTLEALVPRLRDRARELAVDVSEGLPRLSCDDAQAIQVLLILLNNALDVADVSGVRLEVREQLVQADGAAARPMVRFSVIDNGPGIPTHMRETVFHPFFTTKPNGIGLGLSIAQQIAHENGGTLELTSSSRGCVFSLVLPALP